MIKGHRKRFLALAVGALLCGPAAASANETPLETTIQVTDASRSTCEAPAWTQPFRAIEDHRYYVLAPAGSFAGSVAPGWQLRNGARLTHDAARGPGLALPAGSSAVTPAFCLDLNYPHMRFAHKVVGRNASGVEIKIEVVYPQNLRPMWTEVKQFDGYQGDVVSSGWRITPDVDLKPDLGGSAWGARHAALRFTAVKKSTTSAEVRVDDVFIDPYMRR